MFAKQASTSIEALASYICLVSVIMIPLGCSNFTTPDTRLYTVVSIGPLFALTLILWILLSHDYFRKPETAHNRPEHGLTPEQRRKLIITTPHKMVLLLLHICIVPVYIIQGVAKSVIEAELSGGKILQPWIGIRLFAGFILGTVGWAFVAAYLLHLLTTGFEINSWLPTLIGLLWPCISGMLWFWSKQDEQAVIAKKLKKLPLISKYVLLMFLDW